MPGQQLRVTRQHRRQRRQFRSLRPAPDGGARNRKFSGAAYDPGLNILALRKGLSVEAGVEVTGTALRPLVQLVSTPTVPDSENSPGSCLDVPRCQRNRFLSAAHRCRKHPGGRSGGITAQLKQTLGVDELSLRQAEYGNSLTSPASNDNPLSSQIITVGKRLSARAFISYEQGITASGGRNETHYT